MEKLPLNWPRLCAFLAPDAIPDKVFLTRVPTCGSIIAFAMCLLYGEPEYRGRMRSGDALRSVAPRQPTRPVLPCTGLAQEVLRNPPEQWTSGKIMAERAVCMSLAPTFPVPDFPTWPLCAQLLPHATRLRSAHFQEHALDTPQALPSMLHRARDCICCTALGMWKPKHALNAGTRI